MSDKAPVTAVVVEAFEATNAAGVRAPYIVVHRPGESTEQAVQAGYPLYGPFRSRDEAESLALDMAKRLGRRIAEESGGTVVIEDKGEGE